MKRFVKLAAVLAVSLAFCLPAVQAHDPYRPGTAWQSHRFHHHRGLQITSVLWRSPAAMAGLERGDVILRVDGRSVDRPEELHSALHRTGSQGVLTIRDIRTGRIRQVRVFPSRGHIGVAIARPAY